MILPASSAPAMARVVAALEAGEVVAVPTDTVYGLAVAASVPGATTGLFRAKKRPPEVALPVLVAGVGEALALASAVSPAAHRLVERWWPGPLTVVLHRGPSSQNLDLGGDGATIGIRCPDHDLVRDLARRVGPLVATSANRHGQPTPPTARGVAEALAGMVEIVVDGGACEGSPSTVVDCTGDAPRLLREGRIPWPDLLATIEPPGAD